MKITLAYLPEEANEATAVLAELRQRHPKGKVRMSENHPPYRHIYLTTKMPQKSCKTRDSD